MATSKGELLEELTREFFSQQGYFAVRSVPFRAYGNDVSDLDVLLYRRVGATSSRLSVDVKAKRSPKAFERVLWARGMKEILDLDGAIVATTDTTDAASRFANDHNVGLVTRDTIATSDVVSAIRERLTLEEFDAAVKTYEHQKSDGDWLQRIADAKSALISGSGFPAFNRLMLHFRFFAERVYTKPQQSEIALRCTLLCSSLACIALDQAAENVQYSNAETRAEYIRNGVIYGDNNYGRTKTMIARVMNLLASSVPNGEVIRRSVEKSLSEQFDNIRADVISEHFSNLSRYHELVDVARTLESLSFSRKNPDIGSLPAAAKAALGTFLDFTNIPRQRLFQPSTVGVSVADLPAAKEPKLL